MSKTLEYYLNLHYSMIIEYDEDEYYVARYPDLPGFIGADPDLLTAVNEAIECKKTHMKALFNVGKKIPEPRTSCDRMD